MEFKKFEFSAEEKKRLNRKFAGAAILGCVFRIVVKYLLMIGFMAAFEALGYYEHGLVVKAMTYITSVWLTRMIYRDIWAICYKEEYGSRVTIIEEVKSIFETFKSL